MLSEEKDGGVLKRTESILKRDNTGAGIDRLVMYFYGKTYKSEIWF